MPQDKAPHPDDAGPARLYLLTPPLSQAQAFLDDLEAAMDAGDVACVLLDFASKDEGEAKKIVRVLAPIVQGRGAALLVQGDPRFAARVEADGIHLRLGGDIGLADLAEAIARCRPDRIVGAGGLRNRDDAMNAGEQEVDYVMFGEPAPDGWTPPAQQTLERASWWAEIFNVLCVAFADSLDAISALAAAGVDFIALGDAVWKDLRGPAAAVRDAQASILAARRG